MAPANMRSSQPPLRQTSALHNLPREIRNLIWEYSVDWPDLADAFPNSDLHDPRSIATLAREKKIWSTPPILLVDRQTSSEALEVLYAKPLIFDTQAPASPWLQVAMDTRTHVSTKTLQRLRFVIMKMNLHHEHMVSGAGYWWLRNVSLLIPVWWAANKLEQLTIHAAYTPPPREPPWNERMASHHTSVMRMLRMIQIFHEDNAPVVFEGEILT